MTAAISEAEFEEFLTFHYLRRSAIRPSDALAFAATTALIADPSYRPVASYCFRRLAELHPGLVEDYRAVHAALGATGAEFVGEVLASIDSGLPESVLDRPIRTATDNDLHWAEFCLTGDLEAVRRLVDVLARPDRVRERLEHWLGSEPSRGWLPGAGRRRRKALARLRAAGIACDPAGRQVESHDDLDCLVMLDGLEPSRERYRRMQSALPLRLTVDDTTYLGVKATAAWSLAGFARRHPPVLELCREEARRRTGPVHRLLRRIVASTGTAIAPDRVADLLG